MRSRQSVRNYMLKAKADDPSLGPVIKKLDDNIFNILALDGL